MAERTTAEDRLDTLLHIFAFASGEEGATLGELAAALHITPDEVRRCIEEAAARSFYQPAGTPDPLQLSIEEDRVHVWAGDEFRRPPRLTGHEVLALELGLRVLAGDATPDRAAAILDLVRRLSDQLATPGADALARTEPAGAEARHRLRRRLERRIEGTATVEPAPPDGPDVEELLLDAIDAQRLCRMSYLKPGGAAPEDRTVAPYRLVQATGRWYLLAHDAARDGVRLFRLDRILDVAITEQRYELPSAFDAHEYLGDDGVPFASDSAAEARVRYSPRVARWLAERVDGEVQEDGALVVRHAVSDADWLVRHVLRYGGEAEVLEPEVLRRRVADTARRIAGD
jgi:proteasome accessory factor C